jgi:hypothetical protein
VCASSVNPYQGFFFNSERGRAKLKCIVLIAYSSLVIQARCIVLIEALLDQASLDKQQAAMHQACTKQHRALLHCCIA